MRHRVQKSTLDRTASVRTALLRTLAISLLKSGKIQTTPAKAKALKQFVEPIITKGKVKSVHTIRHIESVLGNKEAALHVVNSVSPRFVTRPGGYISAVKVENRKGDNTQQVILQLVD